MPHTSGRRQQYGHVAWPYRSGTVPSRDQKALLNECRNARGHECRLVFVFGRLYRWLGFTAFLFVRIPFGVAALQKPKFGAVVTGRRGKYAPGDKCLRLGVGHFAGAFGHDPRKQVVCCVEDLGPRAKVCIQTDERRFLGCIRCDAGFFRCGSGRRFCSQRCKAMVLANKDSGVGEPKAVDGLAHVTDHEQLAPAIRYGLQNLLLQQVYVLVLIHEHLMEPPGHRLRQLGWRATLIE